MVDIEARTCARLAYGNPSGLEAPDIGKAPLPMKRYRRELSKRLREVPLIVQILAGFLTGRAPIIVYTMGKVGTATYRRSLAAQGLRTFTEHNIGAQRRRQRLEEGDILYVDIPFTRKITSYLLNVLYLSPGRRCFIITGVREPVAQVVSRFFHSSAKRSSRKAIGFDHLQETFGRHLDRLFQMDWFDTEFNPITGIDVFNHPFDRERGWTVIRRGQIGCLILKLESSQEAKEAAIRSFLSLDEFTLDSTNVTAEKTGGAVYLRFKNQLNLSSDLLDTVYDSKYARHFYTDAEIERFKARWLDGA